MKLRVGVIGVGNMGLNHVRVYSSIKDVDFIAISDIDIKLGERVAEKYNLKFYSDYNEMIKNEKIDIVSVCVPTKYHFVVAKDLIKNKINVLLEKPISLDLNDAGQLIKLAKKQKVKLLVGHIERFNPAVIKVKEIIDSGQLGDIIAIIARRVGGFPPQIYDVNIAVDLLIHDIDIVNYLLNDLPKQVTINKQRNHITEHEDSAELFLKYKKTSAYLQANWITPVKIRKLNITGKEGYLEMDYVSQEIEYYKSNYQKFKQRYENYSDYVLEFSEPEKLEIKVAKKEPLREEILYFIDCVKYNKQIDSTFALKALEIALKQ